MKINEVRELSNEELSSKKRELRHESFNLRLQQATGQLERPSRLNDIRKEVARLETVVSERRNKATSAA